MRRVWKSYEISGNLGKSYEISGNVRKSGESYQWSEHQVHEIIRLRFTKHF